MMTLDHEQDMNNVLLKQDDDVVAGVTTVVADAASSAALADVEDDDVRMPGNVAAGDVFLLQGLIFCLDPSAAELAGEASAAACLFCSGGCFDSTGGDGESRASLSSLCAD